MFGVTDPLDLSAERPPGSAGGQDPWICWGTGPWNHWKTGPLDLLGDRPLDLLGDGPLDLLGDRAPGSVGGRAPGTTGRQGPWICWGTGPWNHWKTGPLDILGDGAPESAGGPAGSGGRSRVTCHMSRGMNNACAAFASPAVCQLYTCHWEWMGHRQAAGIQGRGKRNPVERDLVDPWLGEDGCAWTEPGSDSGGS